MHLDLLHEHDRFIPGWHLRPEPSSMRAEFTRPEWRWPETLRRVAQALKGQSLAIFRLSLEALHEARALPAASTQFRTGN